MRPGILFPLLLLLGHTVVRAQEADSVLTLPESIRIAMINYAGLKAKQDAAGASALEVRAAKKDGLPDFIVGAEAAYGTLDGMNGLSSGQPGLTTITSGPVTTAQNWNAAFGALYVTNINWNLFSFGLQRSHVAAANGQYRQDQEDLRQEKFQQQVRVAGAYLSLLAAQRMRRTMEDNLQRAAQLRDVILRRTENGLNPGVDSSIANAELSDARISLIDALNYEQAQSHQLSIQMGVAPRSFLLDSSFSILLPKDLPDGLPMDVSANPTLQFLESRVSTSKLVASYIQKAGLPRVSLFAVGQGRGSGFGNDYAANLSDYSMNFFQGVQPSRLNYLGGIGITWNIADFSRSKSRASAQRYRTSALTDEYQLQRSKLINDLALSDQQIRNALAKYRETPFQLKSAEDAYTQKKALYDNGLTTIVEVSQTMYFLNKAEIARSISCNAVWQALLFKAGTTGDLNLFLQQF